jgi:hypothetical protein
MSPPCPVPPVSPRVPPSAADGRGMRDAAMFETPAGSYGKMPETMHRQNRLG